MVAVYKYRIEDTIQWINAPVINWLTVDWQEKEQCYVAWAMVDLDAADRKFQIVSLETGEQINGAMLDGYQHLGTVNSNYYVLHFFVGEFNPETEEIMKDDER